MVLGPSEVGAVLGADLDDIALFVEEGDLHRDTCFEDGGFGGIVGGIAFQTFRGVGDLQFDVVGEVDGDGVAFDEEDFDDLAFFDEVFGVADETFVDADGLVGIGVHEVVGAGLGVGELELLAVGIDNIDLFTGGEADGFGFSGFEGADGGGDEGIAFAGGAVLKSEDDSALSFILDALAFFEVGCDDCHICWR